MDKYVAHAVGAPLTQCLGELLQIKPRDPIEWIAHWLYRYVDNEIYFQEKTIFLQEMNTMQTKMNKERALRRRRMMFMRAQIRNPEGLLQALKKGKPFGDMGKASFLMSSLDSGTLSSDGDQFYGDMDDPSHSHMGGQSYREDDDPSHSRMGGQAYRKDDDPSQRYRDGQSYRKDNDPSQRYRDGQAYRKDDDPSQRYRDGQSYRRDDDPSQRYMDGQSYRKDDDQSHRDPRAFKYSEGLSKRGTKRMHGGHEYDSGTSGAIGNDFFGDDYFLDHADDADLYMKSGSSARRAMHKHKGKAPQHSKQVRGSQKLIVGEATWSLDGKLSLVCDHTILGHMTSRPPTVPPETPEWWEKQGFLPQTLYDHEVYSQ